jgi:hypothetical protein
MSVENARIENGTPAIVRRSAMESSADASRSAPVRSRARTAPASFYGDDDVRAELVCGIDGEDSYTPVEEEAALILAGRAILEWRCSLRWRR